MPIGLESPNRFEREIEDINRYSIFNISENHQVGNSTPSQSNSSATSQFVSASSGQWRLGEYSRTKPHSDTTIITSKPCKSGPSQTQLSISSETVKSSSFRPHIYHFTSRANLPLAFSQYKDGVFIKRGRGRPRKGESEQSASKMLKKRDKLLKNGASGSKGNYYRSPIKSDKELSSKGISSDSSPKKKRGRPPKLQSPTVPTVIKRPVGRPSKHMSMKRQVGRPSKHMLTKRPVGRPSKHNLLMKRPVGRPRKEATIKNPIGRPKSKVLSYYMKRKLNNLKAKCKFNFHSVCQKKKRGRPPKLKEFDLNEESTRDRTYIGKKIMKGSTGNSKNVSYSDNAVCSDAFANENILQRKTKSKFRSVDTKGKSCSNESTLEFYVNTSLGKVTNENKFHDDNMHETTSSSDSGNLDESYSLGSDRRTKLRQKQLYFAEPVVNLCKIDQRSFVRSPCPGLEPSLDQSKKVCISSNKSNINSTNVVETVRNTDLSGLTYSRGAEGVAIELKPYSGNDSSVLPFSDIESTLLSPKNGEGMCLSSALKRDKSDTQSLTSIQNESRKFNYGGPKKRRGRPPKVMETKDIVKQVEFKRKRGRPPKTNNSEFDVESAQSADEIDETLELPFPEYDRNKLPGAEIISYSQSEFKSKRGRPRKMDCSVFAPSSDGNDETLESPFTESDKNESSCAENNNVSQTELKRKKGRPPKTDSSIFECVPSSFENEDLLTFVPKIATNTSTCVEIKNNSQNELKRKRGRPRKTECVVSEVESVPSSSEDEDRLVSSVHQNETKTFAYKEMKENPQIVTSTIGNDVGKTPLHVCGDSESEQGYSTGIESYQTGSCNTTKKKRGRPPKLNLRHNTDTDKQVELKTKEGRLQKVDLGKGSESLISSENDSYLNSTCSPENESCTTISTPYFAENDNGKSPWSTQSDKGNQSNDIKKKRGRPRKIISLDETMKELDFRQENVIPWKEDRTCDFESKSYEDKNALGDHHILASSDFSQNDIPISQGLSNLNVVSDSDPLISSPNCSQNDDSCFYSHPEHLQCDKTNLRGVPENLQSDCVDLQGSSVILHSDCVDLLSFQASSQNKYDNPFGSLSNSRIWNVDVSNIKYFTQSEEEEDLQSSEPQGNPFTVQKETYAICDQQTTHTSGSLYDELLSRRNSGRPRYDTVSQYLSGIKTTTTMDAVSKLASQESLNLVSKSGDDSAVSSSKEKLKNVLSEEIYVTLSDFESDTYTDTDKDEMVEQSALGRKSVKRKKRMQRKEKLAGDCSESSESSSKRKRGRPRKCFTENTEKHDENTDWMHV